MKVKIFLTGLILLVGGTAIWAQDQNPVLKNTFTVSDGNVVTVSAFNEIQKSDISYKELKEMQKAIESLKKEVKEAEKEIKEARKIIKDQKETINDQKKELRELDATIRQLKRDVEELQKKR